MREIDHDLKKILKDPLTSQTLTYKDTTIVSKDGKNTYQISNGIPIMLPITDSIENNHVEHYRLDAKHFNYFESLPLSWKMENKRLHQSIIHAGKIKGIKMVMDVGSGGGWLVKHIINKTKTKIIAFDLSFDNVLKLQKLFSSKNNLGVVGDALNFPIKDNCLERIFSIEVIEHIPKPKDFVSNLLSALDSNGKLVISTPYKEKIAQSLCIHCNKPTPHDAHLHSFDERSLLKLIPKGNYKVKFKKCNNTILLKMQLHLLLKFLPYSIWNAIDQLFIKLTGKAARIIMQISKE